MDWPRLFASFVVAGLVSLLVTGCGGGGPELGQVTGTITLDGQPVEGVTVLFQPAEGRASAGVTDSQGKYELGFAGDQMGALVGQHTVKIIPPTEDDEGNPLPKPVRIPDKYNQNSELTADVKPGTNEFSFDLES